MLFTQFFTGKILGKGLLYLGLGAALYFGIRWLWTTPEGWNPRAGYYFSHANKLGLDSVRWHTDSVGLRIVIAGKDSVINVRDSTITLLTAEYNKAIQYGKEWKQSYAEQVAVSDATANRLSDNEKQLATYEKYRRNGTLRTDIKPISPEQSEVITAAFQTADREEIGRKALDSLGRSVGTYRAETERLGSGLKRRRRPHGQIGRQLADCFQNGRCPHFPPSPQKGAAKSRRAISGGSIAD